MATQPRPFSEDVLLDFVRGSASPELSRRIAAESARDPAFMAEIALMRGLGPALARDGAANAPGEFGWRRLEVAIRREAQATPAIRPPRQTVYWRAAAAVFGIVALGQAAYIAVQSGGSADPVYRAASGPTEAYVLGVAFRAEARAGDIQALLKTAKGQMTGGPGTLGLYRIAFASAEDMDAGRALCEASPLVELVAEE